MATEFKQLLGVAKEMAAAGVEIKTIGVKAEYLEKTIAANFKKVAKDAYSATALSVLGLMGLIKPAKKAAKVVAPVAEEPEAEEVVEEAEEPVAPVKKVSKKAVKAVEPEAEEEEAIEPEAEAEAEAEAEEANDPDPKKTSSVKAVKAFFKAEHAAGRHTPKEQIAGKTAKVAAEEEAEEAGEPEAAIDEDQLHVAADAMNRVMDLDPAIDTEAEYATILETMRKEAFAKDGLREEDFGSKEGFTKDEAGILQALFPTHKVFRIAGTPTVKAGKPVAGKPAKAAPKAPKAPKADVVKGVLGAREGSKRDAYDKALVKGGTCASIAKQAMAENDKCSERDCMTHLKFRIAEKLVVETKTKSGDAFYKIAPKG